MTNPPESFMTNRRERKKQRSRRTVWRARIFWLSALPAFLLASLGWNLATLNADFARAMGHYEAEEWWDAGQEFRDMSSPNLVDRWKVHFNIGTAAYRNESYLLAEYALEDALALVPDEHRCDVQTNLSLVYEKQGDHEAERAQEEFEWAVAQAEAEIAREQGEPFDPELFQLDWNDEEITSADRFERAEYHQYFAAEYYAAAAEAVNDPACQQPPAPDASPEEQEEAEQQQEQREAEQERLEEQALEAEQERQDIERTAQGEEPQDAEPEPGDGGAGEGDDEGPGSPEPGEDEQEGGGGDGETAEERAAREEEERQAELDERNELGQEMAEGGEGGEESDDDADGPGGSGPPRSNW